MNHDQLPPLAQLRTMEPDEIGRRLLPRMLSSNHALGFSPRDLARGEADRFPGQLSATDKTEIASLAAEGVGWLERAGFLIEAPENHGGRWLRLSRAGLRAARQPHASLTSVAGQEARTLLHPSVANAALGDFERGELDKAAFSAFRALEIAVRSRSKLESAHSKDVFYDAFAHKGDSRGPLVPSDMENGEAISLREVFAGAYGFFRSPSAHRDTLDDPVQTMRLLTMASALFDVLDSLPTAN